MDTIQKLLLALFVTLAVGGGAFFMNLALQRGNSLPETATVWPKPIAFSQFNLIDHESKPFDRDRLHGQWSLMFFGFTHCPDICPATLQQLAIVQSRLAEAGQIAPEILLVSVDPERDTVDKMATYVAHFGSRVTGVTGKLDEIRKLTSTAGIFFEKSFAEDGLYSVDHSAVVLLINENASIHASFSAPHVIDSFFRDLPRITGSK